MKAAWNTFLRDKDGNETLVSEAVPAESAQEAIEKEAFRWAMVLSVLGPHEARTASLVARAA